MSVRDIAVPGDELALGEAFSDTIDDQYPQRSLPEPHRDGDLASVCVGIEDVTGRAGVPSLGNALQRHRDHGLLRTIGPHRDKAEFERRVLVPDGAYRTSNTHRLG